MIRASHGPPFTQPDSHSWLAGAGCPRLTISEAPLYLQAQLLILQLTCHHITTAFLLAGDVVI